MKNIFLSSLFILLAIQIHAQAKGYLGKENFIAVSIPIHLEFTNALGENPTYNKKEDQIESPYGIQLAKLFSLGLNAEYYRILSRRAGVGVEFNYFNRNGISKARQYSEFDYEEAGNILTYIFTNPRMAVTTYKGYFTYSSSTSFLPIGVRHKLGIGLQNYNIRPSSVYYQDISNHSTPEPVIRLEDVPEGLKKSYSAIEFSYGASFSYAISEFLFIDLGFDFRFPYFNINEEVFQERRDQNNEILATQPESMKKFVMEKVYNGSHYYEENRFAALYDMLSFKIGISYAF